MQGVDYAWGTPPFDEFVKQGFGFAMRYISLDPKKDLTSEELTELWRRGIGVVLVFETTANRALGGRAAGAQDAELAFKRCNSLGLPVAPVYFAVDFDATDAQKPTIADYLAGAASVLGKNRVGVYGGFYVIDYMYKNKAASWFWQTLAWSNNMVHPQTHIYQYKNGINVGGLSCDLDKSLKPDFGISLPKREPATVLRAETGYWAWVAWRLGEQDWSGWGPSNPAVRPNVPKRISPLWWARWVTYMAARRK